MERSRCKVEERLEGALRLILFSENILGNTPKQTNRIILEILALGNNTRMTISKVEGEIIINEEKL